MLAMEKQTASTIASSLMDPTPPESKGSILLTASDEAETVTAFGMNLYDSYPNSLAGRAHGASPP